MAGNYKSSDIFCSKTEILDKSDIAGLFGQNFQRSEINQKSEKAFPVYMYLDGFGKFLKFFIQKIFLPLIKENGGGGNKKKTPFLAISKKKKKKKVFSQKSDDLCRFLVKFLC